MPISYLQSYKITLFDKVELPFGSYDQKPEEFLCSTIIEQNNHLPDAFVRLVQRG
jgi:hypothetical protein